MDEHTHGWGKKKEMRKKDKFCLVTLPGHGLRTHMEIHANWKLLPPNWESVTHVAQICDCMQFAQQRTPIVTALKWWTISVAWLFAHTKWNKLEKFYPPRVSLCVTIRGNAKMLVAVHCSFVQHLGWVVVVSAWGLPNVTDIPIERNQYPKLNTVILILSQLVQANPQIAQVHVSMLPTTDKYQSFDSAPCNVYCLDAQCRITVAQCTRRKTGFDRSEYFYNRFKTQKFDT